MSTGVVVNGYEIRNWHTVSILELYRARKGQERGREPIQPEIVAPDEVEEQRSNDMPREKRALSSEDTHMICRQYEKGKSIKELSRQYRVGLPRIRDVLAEGGIERRRRGFNLTTAEAIVADPVPDGNEQVAVGSTATEGIPEMLVAAAPEPVVDEAALELGRTRARELHARTSRVVAVQELPTLSRSVLARQPYEAPRILESGSVVDVANPHAAAKLVEGLVARLNEVPGFQAYFEWRSQGAVGQPLAR